MAFVCGPGREEKRSGRLKQTDSPEKHILVKLKRSNFFEKGREEKWQGKTDRQSGKTYCG